MQSFFLQWWDKIVAGFAHGTPLVAPSGVIITIVVVAVVLSIPRITWRYFGQFVTVVHELGHAFAGLMTGRLITGIKLHKDQSGTTHSVGRPGIGAVWSGFWGYPAPAVVGAALVWCSINGWSSAALSVSTIIIAATLLFIRNFYGALLILACSAASALLAWFAPEVILGYITLSIGIALIVGAVRDWLNVASVHFVRRNELQSSDAYNLFRQTMIPSPIWLLLFLGVIGGSCFLAYTEFMKVVA